MNKIKPCPFCGAYDFDLRIGTANDASAFWDSAVRGSEYGFVKCDCGCIVKARTEQEAIDLWNKRVNNWISLKERLPEFGKKVLFAYKPKRKGYKIGWLDPGLMRVWYNSGTPLDWFSHWMPLPEAPEGGEAMNNIDEVAALEKIIGEFKGVDAGKRLEAQLARHLFEHGVRLQKWIDPKERLPENDEVVLVCVSGNPQPNISFRRAICAAAFYSAGGYMPQEYETTCDWVIQEFPAWDKPTVHCWMPLPEAPEEGEA